MQTVVLYIVDGNVLLTVFFGFTFRNNEVSSMQFEVNNSKAKHVEDLAFLHVIVVFSMVICLSYICEILMEERRECDETMSRENRRVAAISRSWTGSAGYGEDLPPPRHSRVPAAYVCICGSAGKSVTFSEQSLSGPTTYLVAPNSEVLAQLMRDNETSADAGQPASAFNTFTVEFSNTSSSNSNPASPQHKSKTNGSKNQPVYANIMMADVTSAAAAVATNPAQYRDVRIRACRVEQQHTPPYLIEVCMEPNEPSREHMEPERRMLEWKLRQQQRQSEEDSRWLAEEESFGKNKFFLLDERAVVVKKLEPTPTARLDRTHDKVYDATTSFRAVMLLSQGVQQAKIENYVDLVEMAHKVLSKDMAELVSALKLDERCSTHAYTTLDND
ncbi:hypothetical protein DAPPUDRAFT_326013 [Daphnia pulex]|uniref:Focal AT domain-containing protein n=1 Tax=Daphnia pulex TaxID=6669 RepID=E9H6G8_DAPPU|nr:hypothetical protein DAPPUDRAFT_326013 [Daphnia pulex]|eukprot:EFX72700.1 hypothetical protein DAPPUDRAFT_326013 [Daphnia pulex]